MTRLPYETLHRRYVQLHKQVQQNAMALTKMQIRNEILEAENKALHERLGDEVADPRKPTENRYA